MYLATVVDVYSRKLVGHALADHMRVSLVIEALSHARKVRGSLKADTSFGPINHKKVARIMKAMGLKGFTKRRRCITTKR